MSFPQLIDSHATNFTGTAVATHTANTSSLTLPGDLLYLICFFQGSTAVTTPVGWTLQAGVQGSPTNTPTHGTLATFFKFASVIGSESVSVDTYSGATFGVMVTFTVRGAQPATFINYDFNSNTNSSTTYTTPGDSTSRPYTGVIIFAVNDDVASQTWSISPSLTQQAFGYASEMGQVTCYFDLLPTQGTMMSYAMTKTGSITAGIAAITWFDASSVVVDGIPANGTVGSSYSSSITASGGQGGPYTFTIIKGQLPPGLTLNSSTGAITGTPTTGGHYSFMIRVEDAGQTSTQTTSIIISGGSAPPPGSPVAAFVFDFLKTFLTTRSGGSPGQGTWTSPTVFNDQSVTGFETGSLSAGGLTDSPSALAGVLGFDGNTGKLTYFGSGTPDVPRVVTFPGQLSSTTHSGYFDSTQGAWGYGSNLYAFVNNFGSGLWVIKSTDGGVTWTGQDTSNSPEGHTRAAVQRVGDQIVVFSATSTPSFGAQFQTFDMATDTWSAPFGFVDSFPLSDFGVRSFMNVVFKYYNGDYGVVYNHNSSGSGYGIVFQLYSKGSWGREIYIPYSGTPYGDIGNAVFDPATGTIHLFTYGNTEDPVSAATYHTISHKGVVHANLFTFPAEPASGDGFGHPSIQDGLILVPYDDFAAGSNAVWVATLGTSTFFPEYLPIPDGEWGFASSVLVHTGGTGYTFGDTGFVSGGDGKLEYYVSQVSGGAVQTISLLAGGSGYLPVMGAGTTRGGAQPGSGSGLTVNIVAVQSGTPSCAYMTFPNWYIPVPQKARIMPPQFYKRGTAHGA